MIWTQSQRQVFGSVRGVTWGNLVPPFRFVALFFACARDDCALSEYPKSADCFNDILEKRHRFWAGLPRKMAKPAHSQIGGFGGVGGGNLVPAFQFVALFFACAREDCALPEYPRGVNWYISFSGHLTPLQKWKTRQPRTPQTHLQNPLQALVARNPLIGGLLMSCPKNGG